VEQEEVTTTSELLPEAIEACKSNDQVKVTPDEITDEQRADMRDNGGYIFFEPANPANPAVGISLYPGGRIDARSFAPAAQMLAKEGYYVAIFPMPNFMAIGDAIYRVDEVMADHPEITNWLATGHSMGGTAAGQYLHDKLDEGEADRLIGLVIMGSYMDKDHDLSGEDVPVMMMFGTEERIANADKSKYDDARAWLPADTIHFPIEGGFHFGFCFSENPRDDEIPLITQPEQHDIYVPEIVSFIQGII
jgi:pimeloyl-ACP methyl ester carboxylesterase